MKNWSKHLRIFATGVVAVLLSPLWAPVAFTYVFGQVALEELELQRRRRRKGVQP